MKKLLCFSMLALSLTATSLATAQDYPVRPIKMIVPFPPAGGTDNVARIVAQQVSQDLGQSITIENRAGAAGMIGADAVAKAEPDGYTIVLTTNSTHVIGPLLNPKTPYSPTKSFSPVIYLAQSPSIMVVPVSSPAKTVKEFIELAKKNPGEIELRIGWKWRYSAPFWRAFSSLVWNQHGTCPLQRNRIGHARPDSWAIRCHVR